MARTYSTDEVMAMMQAPREDIQMLDKPASLFLDPAQINAAERELSDDPNFFVDQTPAPQRPDGGNAALYPSKQETQPSLPKPVYSTDEVMALYTNESKPVYSTKDVMKQMIAPLYDPTAPRPSRDEYFKLKDMEKSLKESGDIEDPSTFEIATRAVGGVLVTAADALATATFKVDPQDALFTVGGIGVNPGKAIDDTLKRKDATVRLAGEFVKQQYNAMSEGLAAIGGPKYRVKETGEFVTSMQQGLDAAKMGQAGGMAGVPAADDSALIERYKKQGLNLVPVGEEDLKDWEYQQWGKKMDRNLAIEQAANTPRPPDVLYRLAAGLKPAVTDYITGRNDYAEAVAPVLANESQANVLSMGVDPMVWATSGIGATTRLGISAAAKGATAETLGIFGKVAQKVVQPTEEALTKAEAFKRLVVSPAKVASAYGAASGVAWAADKLELPSELKTAAFTAASLYGAYKAGVGVLRFTANKLPEASVILRESANANNGFDVAARKAVAANADVPYSIRERLLRPSQFVAMESTPARLAKNMELSPGTRAMMDKLSNWYVVQGVRGASAVATGAVKGTAASVPFAELMRSAGDEESAAAIYGMGAAFGSAGGAAERAFGARGRRFAQAESDIARFLTDVQGNATGLKDVKRYQWIDTEIGRLLTDVELGAGDVSALVKNRSFDELARTAAMQGFFRERVDFVPLNAADFELNAKGHGADGSAGYFLNMPDGQRPRIFVNVESRRADVEPHEFYEAFFSSDAFSPEQKASMRAAVDNRYGADGLMARGREYAESLIKAENAKNFPNENLFVTSEQIAAKMDQLAQDELGRGGQDALDWVRREVMVEEARMSGIDYAAMRRNVPAGENPITFIENLLGANARALGLSGVRVDPETGMAITPEQLFKENPVAAGDPKLVKQLNGYLKTYKQWLNDPQHETPKGTRIAPDGRAESLANNPNVNFYDGVNGKENSIAFVDASGRVIEKTPKQRAKERKLRGQQIRNMVGSKILEPGNTTFGLKRWNDGRIRAGGKRLPDVMALQTHWKAHLPVIRSIEALSDAGESQQVLYFAKGNSADKVKSSRLGDIDAINREMVFDQWTTNAAGDLLAQFLDLTSVRNRAMKAIAERHPALDPANGGPGYSLQKIMDDVNQWMADKGAGKAGEATIGVPRKNVVNALINPGTNFNRGKNDLAGAFGRGSAIKTLLLENINAVSGTGRKGAAMDYAWANGNFMPDKPAPRPNMDGDLAPPRTIKDISTDQILRELEENQGYLGLSTLGMREGRPVKGGAQRTRELLRRNDELNAELRRRGWTQEESDVQLVLRQRGQAMPDTAEQIFGEPAETDGVFKDWRFDRNGNLSVSLNGERGTYFVYAGEQEFGPYKTPQEAADALISAGKDAAGYARPAIERDAMWDSLSNAPILRGDGGIAGVRFSRIKGSSKSNSMYMDVVIDFDPKLGKRLYDAGVQDKRDTQNFGWDLDDDAGVVERAAISVRISDHANVSAFSKSTAAIQDFVTPSKRGDWLQAPDRVLEDIEQRIGVPLPRPKIQKPDVSIGPLEAVASRLAAVRSKQGQTTTPPAGVNRQNRGQAMPDTEQPRRYVSMEKFIKEAGEDLGVVLANAYNDMDYNEDRTALVGYSDTRNSMYRSRIPVKEFFDWLHSDRVMDGLVFDKEYKPATAGEGASHTRESYQALIDRLRKISLKPSKKTARPAQPAPAGLDDL